MISLVENILFSAWVANYLHRKKVMRFKPMACVLALIILYSGASAATNRFMSTIGLDVGNCSINPCLTLQYTHNQSAAGDTIFIAAGLYPVVSPPASRIILTKQLFILGA